MSNDSITNREKTPPHSQTYANSVSPNPTIGIVIPIYNVEKYLKECLDSVLNQDYPHYEVLLINDGSTDSSLEIAKEYTRKDKRFILFDKENGGLSSARNVGIEYFSGKYTLEHKESIDKHNTDTVIESSLIPFSIISNTKYKIHAVYKSSLCIESIDATHEEYNKDSKDNIAYSLNSFNISIFSKDTIANDLKYNIHTLDRPKIDYIIFLDSDDYWKTDCLSSCVACLYDSNNAIDTSIDIVWFEWEYYYDGVENGGLRSYWELFNLQGRGEKTPSISLLQQIIDKNIGSFPFAPQGMIRFTYLMSIGLMFVDHVYAEDHLFGAMLLTQSNYIYPITNKPYIYRIRKDSLSDRGISVVRQVEPHLRDIYDDFNKDYDITRAYFRYSSWVILTQHFIDFIENYHDKEKAFMARLAFLPYLCKLSFGILIYPEDPFKKIPILCSFMKYNPRITSLKRAMILYPRLYSMLSPCIKLYRTYRLYRERRKKK